MSKYVQREDGEWFELDPRHRLACCDCALVHDVRLRVRKARLEVSFTRNPRATAQRRRWMLPKSLANELRLLITSEQEVLLAKKATKKSTGKSKGRTAAAKPKRSATTKAAPKAKAKKKARAVRKAA